MRIEFLEGYKNGFNKEDNSVTLRINTGPLKQYQNKVINNENINNIMSRLTKEYKYITFSHTFRLVHPNREYNKRITNCQGSLYFESKKYNANFDNLQEQLQKSLMDQYDGLTEYGNMGMKGVHFINIMMKKNERIVELEYDDRKKIKTTTRGYMFNDDDTEKNSRSTIQYGGGSHSKQSNHILMDEKNPNNLENLSKSELINLVNLENLSKLELINLVNSVSKQQKLKIIVEDKTKPSPKPMRPVPTPRKSVKAMVQQYEDNVISPPPQFRDDYKPIPAPITKNHYKLQFQHQELKNQFLKKELSFHKSKKP